MKTAERIIIITNCMECPKISKCKAWNKLTPKQKFTLKTGIRIGKFILKNCPLKEYTKQLIPDIKPISNDKYWFCKINRQTTECADLYDKLTGCTYCINYRYKEFLPDEKEECKKYLT